MLWTKIAIECTLIKHIRTHGIKNWTSATTLMFNSRQEGQIDILIASAAFGKWLLGWNLPLRFICSRFKLKLQSGKAGEGDTKSWGDALGQKCACVSELMCLRGRKSVCLRWRERQQKASNEAQELIHVMSKTAHSAFPRLRAQWFNSWGDAGGAAERASEEQPWQA